MFSARAWEEALCWVPGWVPSRIWHVRVVWALALALCLSLSLLRMRGETEVYVGQRGQHLSLAFSGGLLRE